METISKNPTPTSLISPIPAGAVAGVSPQGFGGLFAGLGYLLDQALARMLFALLAWQGRQIEQNRMDRLTEHSLRDVGLARMRDGRLVRFVR